MDIRTDDELYQVNAYWLGPPGFTMPWRARYIAWGIGVVSTTVVFAAARMWWSLGFFTLAWSLVIGVVITRVLGKKITYQRPFSQVLVMFFKELFTPRRSNKTIGGAADSHKVMVAASRPTAAAQSATEPQADAVPLAIKEVPHV